MKIRAEWEARHALSDRTPPPVLIYTMGKVASTSVYRSVRDSEISNAVFQLHFLSDDLKKIRERHLRAGINPPPYHVFLGEALSRALSRADNLQCKIITLVRDPIAVVVSNLFENPCFVTSELRTENGTIDPDKARRYLEQELSKPYAFDYINNWFDREIKRVFGIDVFAEPFPTKTGYHTYHKDNTDMLLVRVRDLSGKGPAAISAFLGLRKPLALQRSNVREHSGDAKAYREVLKNIRLDPAVCRKIYSSRLATHFYSRERIEQFVAKWSKS